MQKILKNHQRLEIQIFKERFVIVKQYLISKDKILPQNNKCVKLINSYKMNINKRQIIKLSILDHIHNQTLQK